MADGVGHIHGSLESRRPASPDLREPATRSAKGPSRDREETRTPRSSLWLTRADPLKGTAQVIVEGQIRRKRNAVSTSDSLASRHTGEVAERLNAPVSKTGMGGFVHRGFESLPLR